MNLTDECPHGDDATTCPPCRRAAGKDQRLANPVVLSAPFTARFPGYCPWCSLPIHEGQLCVMDRNGPLHAGCAS